MLNDSLIMINENSIKISEPERERECVWLQYWHAAGFLLYVHPSRMWIGVKAETSIWKTESRHSLAVCSGWGNLVVCYVDAFRKATPLSKEIWIGSRMKSTWATAGGKMGLNFSRQVCSAPLVHPLRDGGCAEITYREVELPMEEKCLTFTL